MAGSTQPPTAGGGSLAIVNARLLDPASGLDETGTLVAENGIVTALGRSVTVPDGIEIVDARGRALMPGLVDIRSFGQDAAAAAAGGITSMVLMPDLSPAIDSEAVADHILLSARSKSPVRVYAMGALTKGCDGSEMAEIGRMAAVGAAGFTDGRKRVANAQLMRRIMLYSLDLGCVIANHAEEQALAGGGVMNEGETATRLGLSGIPAVAETIALDRDIRLAADTGARFHAPLITTADSIAAIRAAKSAGHRVTCGTAPQYFALNETAVEGWRTFARVSPPLRAEADRKAVAEAVAEGVIDVICSGHDPKDAEAKRLPFAEAEPGIIGFETLLPLSLELVHSGAPLLSVLAALTCNPADLLGLPGGRLAVGKKADMVLADLEKPWVIDAAAFASKTRNTPFGGRPVQGKVLKTFVGGRTIFGV